MYWMEGDFLWAFQKKKKKALALVPTCGGLYRRNKTWGNSVVILLRGICFGDSLMPDV